MKKFILKILVFFAVLICCFPATISAEGNEAKVGDIEYATIQQALNAANDGDTVLLLKDVTSSEGIIINKSVILDGNSFTFTYTGVYSGTSSAITIYSPNVTLKKLSVVAKTTRFGISCYAGGTLTFTEVKIYGGSPPEVPTFALLFGSAASESVVNITDSFIVGNYGITIWGKEMIINIDRSDIRSIENSPDEDYGAIVLSSDGEVGAENTAVNIIDSHIIAFDENANHSVAIINAAETENINIDDDSVVKGKTIKPVALVVSGFCEYYFESLQDAVNYASSKNTYIDIIKDINIENSISINGKVTINGNGKTLSSSDKKGIIIDTTDEVKINNYKITGKTEDVIFSGISIDKKNANLILDNVSVFADEGFAVVVGETANLSIKNSNLSGVIALSIFWGTGSVVEVIDTELIGTNTLPDSSDIFGTIDIAVDDVIINVFGGSITATSQEGKQQQTIVCVVDKMEDARVYLDAELIIEGTAKIVSIDPNSVAPDKVPIIAVRKEYKQQLNNEGYGVTEPNEDDMVFIDYSIQVFEVTYVAEGTTVAVIGVQNGENVTNPPAVPKKPDYIGAWDHDGTNITENTTVNAVYTEAPVPETGDNINITMWVAMMLLSGLGMVIATIYYRKKRLI
ncbi:MAG: hypothetical protein QM204_00115 [Bacillota bacterium]|nr:hypothetical protein [Bacillota bacterium]NLL26741.1 hypothetical protein [Erysipelotrichia bacterium]